MEGFCGLGFSGIDYLGVPTAPIVKKPFRELAEVLNHRPLGRRGRRVNYSRFTVQGRPSQATDSHPKLPRIRFMSPVSHLVRLRK